MLEDEFRVSTPLGRVDLTFVSAAESHFVQGKKAVARFGDP